MEIDTFAAQIKGGAQRAWPRGFPGPIFFGMIRGMPLLFANLFYIIPFYCTSLWPLIWLFPSCLFLSLYTEKPSVKILLAWSVITISFQLFPLYDALYKMASGPLLLKIAPPLLLILYVSMYVFLLLLMTRKMVRTHDLLRALALWTLALWIYFIFIEYALLWPFGRIEGYVFMNPLLPMSIAPQVLASLRFLPMSIVLLWFCTLTSLLYLAWHTKRRTHISLLLFATAPWIAFIFTTPTALSPAWLKTVGHLPLSLPISLHCNAGQRLLCHELSELKNQHPLLLSVFLPESSWTSSTLSDKNELSWVHNHPIRNVIIGSFFENGKEWHNSLFWFKNGVFQKRFDKNHALPLVERVTLQADGLCSQLYFQQTPSICPGDEKRKTLCIQGIPAMTPYICSDLYCRNWPDEKNHDLILASSNDGWFIPHFQKLMALAARFRGMQWGRPVLYISYHYAQYFDQFGQGHKIATSPSNRYIQ